jgi:hypothetical protein
MPKLCVRCELQKKKPYMKPMQVLELPQSILPNVWPVELDDTTPVKEDTVMTNDDGDNETDDEIAEITSERDLDKSDVARPPSAPAMSHDDDGDDVEHNPPSEEPDAPNPAATVATSDAIEMVDRGADNPTELPETDGNQDTDASSASSDGDDASDLPKNADTTSDSVIIVNGLPSSDATPTAEQLAQRLSAKDMREVLKSRGLATQGTKAILAARMIENGIHSMSGDTVELIE